MPEPVLFPHDGVMPRFELIADVDAGVNDRSGANPSFAADAYVAVGARTPWRIAEDDVRIDDGYRLDTVQGFSCLGMISSYWAM